MKNVHIIYYNYLKPNGEGLSIGGVQTYISNLSQVLYEEGFRINIHQTSDVEFKKKHNNKTVYGYVIPRKRKIAEELWQLCSVNIDVKNDLVIFGSEALAVDTKNRNKTIAIQHGISWDIPNTEISGKFMDKVNQIKKIRKNILKFKKTRHMKLLVCVDYNYINLYRAFMDYHGVELRAIPNFTKIAPKNFKHNKSLDVIKIIFARRFFDYRGTRIFVKAIKRLLKEFDNLDITLAGEGPDEQWMKSELEEFENVKFIRYESHESLEIHQDKDIAVIPTIGSEGTSLSLLEAMTAQCAVICTNVGGMTNIVLDNYNGLMINPDENSLYNAMKKLILDEKIRKKLSQRAYVTVKEGFSYDIWKEKWIGVLKELE